VLGDVRLGGYTGDRSLDKTQLVTRRVPYLIVRESVVRLARRTDQGGQMATSSL
ncbi:MAG: hypothetical protein QOF01_1063, partial [Thermomicrobiales bacterium]|nr:hypothetical protein [Thermomicrobiales bacterium]